MSEFGNTFSTRRVLVTGATGFIGWHLCSELTARGAEVHAVARGATEVSENRDADMLGRLVYRRVQ